MATGRCSLLQQRELFDWKQNHCGWNTDWRKRFVSST